MAIKKVDLEDIKDFLNEHGKFPISIKGDRGFLRNNTPIPNITVLDELEICRSFLYEIYYKLRNKE